MDRVSRLRAEGGLASDDSGASEPGFHTADNTTADSSTYLSFSDEDGGAPKARSEPDPASSTPSRPADVFVPGLSPITQSGARFGGQIDARNILSGGIDIFDDYNSNDGDGLVIDDEAPTAAEEDDGKIRRSTEKVICEPIESANLSFSADAGLTLKDISESQLGDSEGTPPTEQPFMKYDVILQIDGTNVDAVDIGNGLYLYRKDEGGELNAIQILEEEGQQPHFKFLKVREFGEGNLEVYEEVPITDEELEERKLKECKEKGNESEKSSHLPIKDVNKALVHENPSNCRTVAVSTNPITKEDLGLKSEVAGVPKPLFGNSDQLKKSEGNSEFKHNPLKNLEGSRKSPILGNFTSMTLHSSPNREGAPLTKTTINLPLNANRNSDTVKKTIEVSTDQSKLKCNDKLPVGSLLSPKKNALSTKSSQSEDSEDSNKVGVPIEKSDATEQFNFEQKTNDTLSILEMEKEDKKISDVKHVNQDQLSMKIIKQSNNENKHENKNAKVLLNNQLNDQKNFDRLDGLTSDEPRIALESKPNVSGKSIDTKKDVQPNKSNVVSKWVLRSDSTEEKCKKEREKIPLESKPVNSGGKKHFSNDLSSRSSTNDVAIKQTNLKPLNLTPVTNISHLKKSSKDDNKEPKCITNKASVEANLVSGKNLIQNIRPQSFALNLKGIVSQKEDKTCKMDSNKSFQEIIENKGQILSDDTKFVNKYINEAFCMKKVTTETAETLNSQSSIDASDLDNKTNSTEIPSKSLGVKAKNYDSPLRIDIDSPSKPVPFGKWTEGDKKEYLNKLKDQKLPSTNPSLSPAKSYQLASSKNDLKRLEMKKRADTFERAHGLPLPTPAKPEDTTSKQPVTDMKGLIDKTIEGMIKDQLDGTSSRHSLLYPPIKTIPDPSDKSALDELERQMNELHGIPLLEKPVQNLYDSSSSVGCSSRTSDEMLMPKTENSQSVVNVLQVNKVSKIPNLLPLLSSNKSEVNQSNLPKTNNSKCGDDEDSEEEIIDCEPVTGDMPWIPQSIKEPQKSTSAKERKGLAGIDSKQIANHPHHYSADKKTGITEVEFDKFVRRNSTNQLITTSSVATAVENKKAKTDIDDKHKVTKMSNVDSPEKSINMENKIKKSINLLGSQRSQIPQAVSAGKKTSQEPVEPLNIHSSTSDETSSNITYHTKLQLAYQSALSAKRQREPIKVLDDKPVKVPLVGSNAEHVSLVQKLPAAKQIIPIDNAEVLETCDLIACGTASSAEEIKSCDQTTAKSKHQRKQILTPVELPIIELIEPCDQQQQKKNRKSESKVQKEELDSHIGPKRDFKNIIPKKNYLLGRAPVNEELRKDETKEKVNQNTDDGLIKKVKSKQDQEIISNIQNTPKRGRGRPRKYPIQNLSESPKHTPKKPKSVDSEINDGNSTIISDENEEDYSDEERIIRENWTMGKINNKIVCPICNKLFRSESIVFKHVKHCSSLSKSLSKRSSSCFDTASSPTKKVKTDVRCADDTLNTDITLTQQVNIEDVKHIIAKSTGIPQKDINSRTNDNIISLISPSPDQVIMIEDSPTAGSLKTQENNIKTKKRTSVEINRTDSAGSIQKGSKIGRPRTVGNHTCEKCGKSFRQLSYLAHHRNLHTKESSVVENKPVLSCEICRKEFRQLHHLVEHRDIHNTATNSGIQRKMSADRSEQKQKDADAPKETTKKRNENSAEPFRCEPCDKSFRKLHHLVEHRETHDGLNKKNSPPSQPALVVDKSDKPPTASPTCDVCGKAFRKLHHLIEHREQHNDTSNFEKKEKKPTLLAKDIIHECSLCYMVFPNEPSLNKHFVFCQKKKKTKTSTSKEELIAGQPKVAPATVTSLSENEVGKETLTKDALAPNLTKMENSIEDVKPDLKAMDSDQSKKDTDMTKQTPKNKSLKPSNIGTTVTKPAKIGATVTKRARSSLIPLDENFEIKSTDSDDDVRYMINPSYKQDSDEEREIFMNLCVGKRSSLQFDGMSAKTEFKKRRTSLQHPPKTQKLLPKKVEKSPNVPNDQTKSDMKLTSSTVPSTSSLAEDSDIKYSFPKPTKNQKIQSKISVAVLKNQTKNLTTEEISTLKGDKRKSLTGIAKLKSLGKSALMKPRTTSLEDEKLSKGVPKKIVKKQASDAMHVCDCGKRYTSVTLLAQHTSVAHTPPRIRKLRNPDPPPTAKLAKRKASVTKHAGVPVALKKLRDNTDKLDK